MPLEIQCRCTLCSIEAQLLSGLNRLDSRPVNALFSAFPALLEHSTVRSLLSHLRGEPVGTGLKSWLENSPGFRIDAISAPVRIEEYSPHAFLGGWQWYSLMSLLRKPVDFIWIPRGTHLLVKPWERLTSQQGNVDWFHFWLSDGEACDAEDKAICARWRELAALESPKSR